MNEEQDECPICNFVTEYYGLPTDADENTEIKTDLGDLANLVHMAIAKKMIK